MDKRRLVQESVENLDGECGLTKMRKMGNLYSGSKPLKSSFSELKEMGIKRIIDLKGQSETAIDESALAAKEGIDYINIPVDGIGAYNENLVESISKQVDNDTPTLVYCMSANRVPAWLCMTLALDEVIDEEEIIAIGLEMGMDKPATIQGVQKFFRDIE